MTQTRDNAFDALERIFHEPNRLAIMSTVCGAENGVSFRELKQVHGLTDGNLNRHLKVLEEARAVRIEKRFVDGKPRTTVHLSKTGVRRFNEYLEALADVLKAAQRALPAAQREADVPLGKAARA